MYRMAIITMLCPASLSRTIDTQRCTRMALVHDMAEALVGDITPMDNVPKKEKSRREAETMEFICQELLGNVDGAGGLAGKEVLDLWWEYENDETREAHFVHDVDKVELLLQMIEYEKAGLDGKDGHEELDLGEFSRVAERVKMEECKVWVREILRERKEFWQAKSREPSGVGQIGEEARAKQDEYYGGSTNGKA
jgi:putative hydrolase of HD superfamily